MISPLDLIIRLCLRTEIPMKETSSKEGKKKIRKVKID